MHKYLLTIILGLGLTALDGLFLVTRPVAAQNKESSVVFNPDGTVNQPDPHVYRRWVFVGAPLTPEGLNNGKFNCDSPEVVPSRISPNIITYISSRKTSMHI